MLGAENGAIEFQIRTWPSLAFLTVLPVKERTPGSWATVSDIGEHKGVFTSNMRGVYNTNIGNKIESYKIINC